MVLGAILSLAGVVAGLPIGVCLALAIAGVLVPALYSLLVYKRLERSGSLDT
jgi:hypothetical protein